MGVATVRSVPVQTCGSQTEWDWEKGSHQGRGSSPPGTVQAAGMPRQSLSCWWLKMGVRLCRAVLQVGFLPFSKGYNPSCWLFWDIIKPRLSKEPGSASGTTHSIFAISWLWFPSKVTMDRICPLSDREPLPGQDSVGDECCCLPWCSLGMWGLWKEL